MTTTEHQHITGAELVDVSGRVLPLEGTELRVRAGGGIARATLVQRFRNVHDESLRVHYKLPLPDDGAVSGFAFVLDGVRTHGIVRSKKDARERFERALCEGRSAALLEEVRGSVFEQELGNVPPGATIEVEVVVDQPLRWIAPGSWEWRFPTVVGPKYTGHEGRVPDASHLTTQHVAGAQGIDARAALDLGIEDSCAEDAQPVSSSHALRRVGTGWSLAEDARLDRDVVVRWEVATPEPGARLSWAGENDGAAYGLVTLVPPTSALRPVARDLVFLVDVSGSMHGEPLAQARAVLAAMVATLGCDDRLEMVAFSARVERWKSKPQRMHDANKQRAHAWLSALRAGGGTEMRAGIEAAMQSLRDDAQRQIVLVTDGYIGFEAEVIAAARNRLARSCRIHTVGVGHGVNRSLTRPMARVGGGTEILVAPGEDPVVCADELVAATAAPQVVDVELVGNAVQELAAARAPDLMTGAPALIPVALNPAGGTITVRGRTAAGAWSQTLQMHARDRASTELHAEGAPLSRFAKLFARERVADLEARREECGADVGALDAEIERVGLSLQIATRCTSWVAETEGATVDPAAPLREELMPHELPRGLADIGGLSMDSELFGLGAGDACEAGLVRAPRLSEEVLRSFDAFRRLSEEEPSAAEKAAADESDLPPRATGVTDRSGGHGRAIPARIRLRADGRIVLEFVWACGMDWTRPARVVVVFDDGVTAEAEVVDGTQSGALRDGVTLRLVVADPDPDRSLARVELDSGVVLRIVS